MSQNGTFLLVATTWVLLFGFTPYTWSQEKAEDWFLKGNALSRQGQFEEAVEAFENCIILQDFDLVIWIGICDVLCYFFDE